MESRDLKKDFCSLLNLQIITEKLLYQLDIPEEIAEKFQVLRNGTYEAIGLAEDPFTSIDTIFKTHDEHYYQQVRSSPAFTAGKESTR